MGDAHHHRVGVGVWRVEIERDLRRALERDQLFIQYQPTFDLRSGTITGAEALIRWSPAGDAPATGRDASGVEEAEACRKSEEAAR